jgi:hypothetical protein
MRYRSANGLAWLCLVLWVLPGCPQVTRLESEVKRLSDELVALRAKHDDDIRVERDRALSSQAKLWGRIECNNHDVGQFISACEVEGDLGCTPEAMNVAMSFMSTQAYVSLYLRPGDPVETLAFQRRGQVAVLTDPQFQHPSTKYLVLVQPRSDSESHVREARVLGSWFIDRQLRKKFGILSTVKVIGPRVLPCKLKQEQLKGFMRRWDFPVEEEPKEKDLRVRLFVFRTDC